LVCGGAYVPSRLSGLLRCTTCGFVTADLDVTEAAVGKIYGRDYFHGQEYRDYIAEEDSLRRNFHQRIEVLRRFLPAWPQVDVFEIGCAYGFFLAEVAAVVRYAHGIDISAEAVEYAVRKRAVCANAADYLGFDVGDRVDLIAMWDTIEHLRRPDLFVEKAAADLKPGGVIAITTGDIGSLIARLRGRSWRMIHPPSHLHYFSVRTLTLLVNRYGFDVVHVSHPGVSRNLRSVLHFIIALKARRPRLYETLQAFRIFDWQVTANLFDIMYVVARRRPHFRAAG
jgi:SAM-dependent methyltransferase